jgi:1-acyl-sn-glycerol-3-phosphate acyltransferase
MAFGKLLASLITIGVSFFCLVFIINPIQMLSALVYPFSASTCRRINRWCARTVWGTWVAITERQNGTEVRFSGDKPPWRENALVIPNHQNALDIMVLLSLAWRCGRLGDMKWFVKNALKFVPGIGIGMLFLDCIFVKRNWAQDSTQIDSLFKKYKLFQIPVFLVTFLEGTRSTPAKIKSAQSFAKQRGLYEPQKTLVPRTKGFVATIQGLGDHLDAVYDVTIGYPQDPPPRLSDGFNARLGYYDIHLTRYPIASLPSTEVELNDWVLKRFEEKDQRMVAYARDQKFSGSSHTISIRALDLFRAEKSLQ